MSKQFTKYRTTTTKTQTIDDAYTQFLQQLFCSRYTHKHTQEYLANFLHVTQSYFSRQERGFYPFNFKQCCTLHQLYNLDYLFMLQDSSYNITEQQTHWNYTPIENKKVFQRMASYCASFSSSLELNFVESYKNQIHFLLQILHQWNKLGPGYSKFYYFLKAFSIKYTDQEQFLGIRQERCKRLKAGIIYPDSKTLFYIYYRCYCFPSYFLLDYSTDTTIYLLLWQFLKEESKQLLIKDNTNENTYNCI